MIMAQRLMRWWVASVVSLGWASYSLAITPLPHASRTALAPHPSFSACPANVEPLVTELLKDLPSYANRVSQQARRLNRTADFSSYVLVAGRPEFAPLTLGPGEYTPSVASADPPQQIFFTTLERQYTLGKAIELQQYHWLFLTQTTSGWRLAMMFSQIGPYPAGRPPTPPRDSSNGVIAQAIRTWLGDCRSGAVNINRIP